MYTRWAMLMCFICCLSMSCTSSLQQNARRLAEPPRLHPETQVRPMPAFTQVYIVGPFNVRLQTNKKQKPGLTIASDTEDLKLIRSYVKQGVLYVSLGPKKAHIGRRRLRMGDATLDINVPYLQGFTYKGDGVITAHKIHSQRMKIWLMNSKTSTWDGWINLKCLTVAGTGTTKISGIHSGGLRVKLIGEPKVELKGEANLKRLDMEGSSILRFYWVKSKDLIVRLQGTVQLTLAGTVNRLDGVFSDKSHFNGRYLRVKEAFVKTNDEAVSDIAVIGNQHALARDKSDIYYYNLPAFRSDFMARNGSILDMRPEELKAIQPHTTYNR